MIDHADLEEESEEPTAEELAASVGEIGRAMMNEQGEIVKLWRFDGKQDGSC